MAIAYRSGSTAGGGSGTNLTINKPTGTVDGDILICSFYQEIGATAVTPPEGWTEVATQANNNANAWVGSFYKRAASEPASWTWTHNSTWRIGAVACFSGALETGTAYEAAAGNTGAFTTITVNSITTTVDAAMRAVAMANYTGDNPTGSSTGMTPGPQLDGCNVWYEAQATAGASGTESFDRSAGGGGDWAVVHLALKPATGGGGSSASSSPSASASSSPSSSPSASPSDSPSSSPSDGTPSNSPSDGTPSNSPSDTPSSSPSDGTPSDSPSASESSSPSGSAPVLQGAQVGALIHLTWEL